MLTGERVEVPEGEYVSSRRASRHPGMDIMAVFQGLRPVPAGRVERSVRRGSLAGDTKGYRRG
jgi:hypothetical protein